MDSIECAKRRIREVIEKSSVLEDFGHAENTLEWVLKLDPWADGSLQIAALAHDIDRAVRPPRPPPSDYAKAKVAHARRGAEILRGILEECEVARATAEEACRLVTLHEVGGDQRSDLLRDADSLSFFQVNLPLYYQREGWDETKRRCIWGYRRLSEGMKRLVKGMRYTDEILMRLLKEVIAEASQQG